MTIGGAARPRQTTGPGGQDGTAVASDLVAGPTPAPSPAPGADQGRLNTPPFSWLGSDAWPNFPLLQDKPN